MFRTLTVWGEYRREREKRWGKNGYLSETQGRCVSGERRGS